MTAGSAEPRRALAAAALLLIVVTAALHGGCAGRNTRGVPPGFDPDDPIVTGDPALDERIADDRARLQLTDDEIAGLHDAVQADPAARELLDELIRYQIAIAEHDEALDVLLAWTRATGYDDVAMASYLELALGSGHHEECLSATDEFLTRFEDHRPYLMMLRGLCMDRFGRPMAAREMYYLSVSGLETLGGLSGVLQRELGFDTGEAPPDPRARLEEQRKLLDWFGGESILGHVMIRQLGRLTVDDAEVDPRLVDLGGVHKADIDAVFASRRDSFRHCQLMHGKGRRVPGGRLVLDVIIRGDGTPGRVERTRDTFEVQEVPACIEELVGNLRFPAPRFGKPILYEREFRMSGDL